MNGPSSPFYPPRARWYSRWLGRLECLFPSLQPRLVFASSRLGWKGWLAGVVVPGAGFWLVGRPVLARWSFGIHLLLLTLGIAATGFPLGTGALALAAGIHAAGLVCLVHRAMVDRTLLLRIGSLLAPLLLYFQACLLVGEHLFLPLDIGGQVIVVSRLTVPADVRVGDFIACQPAERRVPGFSMGSDFEVGEVLALGGSRIEFGPMHLRTRDGVLPSRYGMPAQGTLALGEKVWFIWPTEINTRRNPEVESLLLQAAQVPHRALVGRAFRHWFGRAQSLP